MFLSSHSSAQDCLLQKLRSGIITPPTDNGDIFKMNHVVSFWTAWDNMGFLSYILQ